MKKGVSIESLPAFVRGSILNVIVDTPQGSGNKFKYNETTGFFTLGAPMPLGAIFPFEFGFIPSTKGGDGDPLDVLILMDAPTFVGCLVEVRLVGVIQATQTAHHKTEQNDRLIGVAIKSRRHREIRELRELPKSLLSEIEHFFISYNETKETKFKPTGRFGSSRALALVRKGIKAYEAD